MVRHAEELNIFLEAVLIPERLEGRSQTEQDPDVYLKPDDFVDLPPGFDFQDCRHRLFELLDRGIVFLDVDLSFPGPFHSFYIAQSDG